MTEQNQHFVPKFLLKNFVDADGRVFCLDIQTDVVTKPAPKNAASAEGFNEFLIRGEVVSFEKGLEQIETRAARSLRTIIDNDSLAALTADDRKNISDFIAAQSFRTEAFRKGLEDTAKEKLGQVFQGLWDGMFVASSEVASRRWLLMKIIHDDVFYLGDNPIVLQNTEDPARAQSVGLDLKGIEAYLPITPKYALYMPCNSTSDQFINAYNTAPATLAAAKAQLASGQQVTESRMEQIKTIERAVEYSREYCQIIESGTPMAAVPENVQNLNYLQCAWSHKHIFSNRRDFTFAKMVFAKTPQYRATMKSEVIIKTALVRA